MSDKHHTFFLFGGSFFSRLTPHLQKLGEVSGQMTGVSPLCQTAISIQGSPYIWLDALEAQFQQCNAEYLVLDLQLAQTQLLCSSGCYFPASDEVLNLPNQKEIAVVNPLQLPPEYIDTAIDHLTRTVVKYFPSDRIILLHTQLSDYHLTGNQLRVNQTFVATPTQKQWMQDLEDCFRKKTGCHYVDVTRFYFYQKEPGRSLTNVIFEKECYLDLVNRIEAIISGGSGSALRPDFSLSLDRYVKYYFTLQKKPQRVFLNPDYFLDNLILSSSDSFVKQYREELLALDKLDWNQPETALQHMKQQDPSGILTRVFTAFYAVCQEDYKNNDADYALMFRCEVVPDVLISYLKEKYAPLALLLPSQINRYNAGYHFAKMRHLDTAPFTTPLTVAKPTVIDIFGSCISRTLFNVQDNDFAVNQYWFHVPFFEHRNSPVDYPSDLFPEKMSWTDRLVKKQFDGTVYRGIRFSAGEWLVIDLYSLISPNTFYFQDCLYGDFDHKISSKLKAKNINLYHDPSIFGTHEDVLRALNPWLNLVKRKYRKKIILIDSQRQNHWIGDDDLLYQMQTPFGCNPYLEKAADYVCKKLGCYRVRIGRHFLPDEAGYMRNTPVHKEDCCYQASHDIVRYIVDNKPRQKCFDQYPGQVHMLHLERLARKNSVGTLEQALPLSELDKAVVRLGYDGMISRHDLLARIYDTADWSLPLQKILRQYVSDPTLAAELRNASQQSVTPSEQPACAYSSYSPQEEIYSDLSGGCNLPKLPLVKLQQIANHLLGVRIVWNAAEGETVHIFRKAADSSWRQIGKSSDGAFIDRTIAPDTTYWYCICSQIPHPKQTNCYLLGNFTVPFMIHTAVAAPKLIRAIHKNGENILQWEKVPNAEGYLVYSKADKADRWQLLTTIEDGQTTSCSMPSVSGGEWYTVRAYRMESGKHVVGSFRPGICATTP